MQQYNILGKVKGDTYNGVQFQYIKDGVPVDLTGAGIFIDFRYPRKTGKLTKALSVGDGITITDAANGEFRIDPFDLVGFEVNKHYYDIQLVLNGVTKTYLEGYLEVIQDVTVV